MLTNAETVSSSTSAGSLNEATIQATFGARVGVKERRRISSYPHEALITELA